MLKQLGVAIRLIIVMSVLTGLLYPLTVTGLAQILLPFQANGSLVVKDGKVIGSRLIGQKFSGPEYFHGRPSAAGENGYDGNSSGGLNLGPTNKQLIGAITERVKTIREQNGLIVDEPLPADLVTTSGSGLDPDISPVAALVQARRVAAVRGLDLNVVHRLIEKQITPIQFGLLGEARVNVLELNLAVDAIGK